MADITVTFEDGRQHVYQNAPDNLSASDVYARAQRDFPNMGVRSLDRQIGRQQQVPEAPSFGAGLGKVASGLGHAARGAAASAVGAPGDIWQYARERPALPGPAGIMGMLPRMLPTSEEVKKVLPFPARDITARRQEDIGGVLGSLVSPSALAGIGRVLAAPFQYAGRVASRALGRETAAATGRLVEDVSRTGREVAERIGGEEAQEAASLRAREAGLRHEAETLRGQEGQQTTQLRIAQEAGERAARREGLAGRGLSGVRTEEEFGQYGLVPQTRQEVGQSLREQATHFVDSIKAQRSARADREITAARSSAEAREAAGQRFVDSPQMADVRAALDRRIATETDSTLVRQLQDVRRSLFEGTAEAQPTFTSAETIRRKLGDAAFGAPEEGYAAIGQNIARDLYGSLSDAMKAFEPGFEAYLNNYRRLSGRVEAAGSRVGRALVGTEPNAPSYFSMSAQQVADRAFNSPENVRALVDALGGNRQPVIAAAERYFGNQLAGKSTQEARAFLMKDNTRALLNELGQDFRRRIETRFLGPASLQASRVEAAGGRAARLQEDIKRTRARMGEAEKQAAMVQQEISRLTPRGVNIETDLERIKLATDPSVQRNAANDLLSKLKKEVNRSIDLSTYARLEQLVEDVKKAQRRQTRARTMLGTGGALGLGIEWWRNR